MTEEQLAAQDAVNVIEAGVLKYKKALEALLTLRLEDLYGGPAKWPVCVNRDEDAEDFAVEIWNAAIEAAVEIVKGK